MLFFQNYTYNIICSWRLRYGDLLRVMSVEFTPSGVHSHNMSSSVPGPLDRLRASPNNCVCLICGAELWYGRDIFLFMDYIFIDVV